MPIEQSANIPSGYFTDTFINKQESFKKIQDLLFNQSIERMDLQRNFHIILKMNWSKKRSVSE